MLDVFDTVRSRVFFFDALSTTEQLTFAENTLTALEDHLIEAQRFLDERPPEVGLSEHLGAIGGMINAQSRVAFIKAVLEKLNE